MNKWQVNIKIWKVNIKIWQDDIKIWQVNIIIWQVMSEVCHHRSPAGLYMVFVSNARVRILFRPCFHILLKYLFCHLHMYKYVYSSYSSFFYYLWIWIVYDFVCLHVCCKQVPVHSMNAWTQPKTWEIQGQLVSRFFLKQKHW